MQQPNASGREKLVLGAVAEIHSCHQNPADAAAVGEESGRAPFWEEVYSDCRADQIAGGRSTTGDELSALGQVRHDRKDIGA
jgi:hypothetical protein